mgnify:CR=1 FL=1
MVFLLPRAQDQIRILERVYGQPTMSRTTFDRAALEKSPSIALSPNNLRTVGWMDGLRSTNTSSRARMDTPYTGRSSGTHVDEPNRHVPVRHYDYTPAVVDHASTNSTSNNNDSDNYPTTVLFKDDDSSNTTGGMTQYLDTTPQPSVAAQRTNTAFNPSLTVSTSASDPLSTSSTVNVDTEAPSTTMNSSNNLAGQTPLHMAAKSGNVILVRSLVRAKVDVNFPAVFSGATPLHDACDANEVEVIDVLLQARANLGSQTDSDGWTPLHHACAHGSVDAVKLLLQAKANLNARTFSALQAQDIAAAYHKTNIVEYLLTIAPQIPHPGPDPVPAPSPQPMPIRQTDPQTLSYRFPLNGSTETDNNSNNDTGGSHDHTHVHAPVAPAPDTQTPVTADNVADERDEEIARLRSENSKLKAKLKARGEELARVRAQLAKASNRRSSSRSGSARRLLAWHLPRCPRRRNASEA